VPHLSDRGRRRRSSGTASFMLMSRGRAAECDGYVCGLCGKNDKTVMARFRPAKRRRDLKATCSRHRQRQGRLHHGKGLVGDDDALRQRRQWAVRVARRPVRRHYDHTRGLKQTKGVAGDFVTPVLPGSHLRRAGRWAPDVLGRQNRQPLYEQERSARRANTTPRRSPPTGISICIVARHDHDRFWPEMRWKWRRAMIWANPSWPHLP